MADTHTTDCRVCGIDIDWISDGTIPHCGDCEVENDCKHECTSSCGKDKDCPCDVDHFCNKSK